MKVERFITEYVKYQKELINNNDLIKTDIKEIALTEIDRMVKYRERGLVTVNETMSAIANIFK